MIKRVNGHFFELKGIKTYQVLNNLIVINNDRIAGFEKALADINDENRPKGTISRIRHAESQA